MNKSQRKELLTFLNTLDENATIHDMSHRFLCFEYNSDRKRKDWIGTDQPMDSAPFEAWLTFPLYKSLTIPFTTTIKDVKAIIALTEFYLNGDTRYNPYVTMIYDNGYIFLDDFVNIQYNITENYN